MNPMQMMIQAFGQNGNLPQFDENLFRKMLPQLDQEKLNQIVSMARNFGISENEIQNGINFISRFQK